MTNTKRSASRSVREEFRFRSAPLQAAGVFFCPHCGQRDAERVKILGLHVRVDNQQMTVGPLYAKAKCLCGGDWKSVNDVLLRRAMKESSN